MSLAAATVTVKPVVIGPAEKYGTAARALDPRVQIGAVNAWWNVKTHAPAPVAVILPFVSLPKDRIWPVTWAPISTTSSGSTVPEALMLENTSPRPTATV